MSDRLGQHLSEQHAQDDPLKDRVWLALQTFLTFASLFIAFGFLDAWGTRSLLVGGNVLAFGSSCLYLLFIHGRWTRIAQGVAAAVGVTLVIDRIEALK